MASRAMPHIVCSAPYGFKSYGGCGTMGPIQGTSGVATGTTMIYVSKEPSACADIVPRDSPPSPPPSNCMDTNPVGAADSRGEACDTYNTWAGTIYDYCSTGWFDDDDFEGVLRPLSRQRVKAHGESRIASDGDNDGDVGRHERSSLGGSLHCGCGRANVLQRTSLHAGFRQ